MKKPILCLGGACLLAASISSLPHQAAAFPPAFITAMKTQAKTYGAVIHVSSETAEEKKSREFIDSLAQNAINFLADESLNNEQKKKKFEKLLNDRFAMKTIGRFAMGRYWRTASPAQREQYFKLFQDMIVDVYSHRFSEYNGQEFIVSSAKAQNEKDTIVQSYIVDQSGKKFSVDWRVRNKNGVYKVVDVMVEGVSMALTQRSDFASVIQRGGGNVDVLIAHLEK